MPKTRIWITRTLPAANKSAFAFERAGYDTVIAPLLILAPANACPPLPEHDAVLVFTSRNGVDFFAQMTYRRHWHIITVGDATAQHARGYGFESVQSAAGDWTDVVDTIQSLFKPNQRPIRHIGGKHVRGRMTEALLEAGYDARRDVYYQSNPVRVLPDIGWEGITHIAFHSPLAAQTLAHFHPDTSHMTALSISPATNAALGDLPFKEHLISTRPNEAAMITALGA